MSQTLSQQPGLKVDETKPLPSKSVESVSQGPEKMDVEKMGDVEVEEKDQETARQKMRTDTMEGGSFGVIPTDEESRVESERLQKIHAERARSLSRLTKADFTTSANFFARLAHIKARDFAIFGRPENKPIWTAKRNELVIDVFQGLISRNINSVPVLTEDGKAHSFIEWVDFVRYIIDPAHFGEDIFSEEKSWSELTEQHQEFKRLTLGQLIDDRAWMKRSAGLPALIRTPLLRDLMASTVMDHLTHEHGNNAVVVVNNFTERRAVNLVTRSQCLKWIERHMDLLGSIKNKPVSLCKGFLKPVYSMNEDENALSAFSMMTERMIEAVAITDQNGNLIGNLSLRDIKACGQDMRNFWRLKHTIKNFLIKLRTENLQATGKLHRHAIFVLPEATLEEVIYQMRNHKIHHIYICESHTNRKLVGAISIREVLEQILSF